MPIDRIIVASARTRTGMPMLIMNLRNVPDDEAAAVRALLRSHHVAFYEPPPGRWGISAGGIWVREREEAKRARELLADYQRARGERARADYEARRRSGQVETLVDRLHREPVRVLVYLGLIALVAGLGMLPLIYLWWGR